MTKKEEWKIKLQECGWPDELDVPLEVNRWGSCQYNGALKVYDLYFKMRNDLSRDDTWELLGIKVTIDGINPISEIKNAFVTTVIQKYHKYKHYKNGEKQRIAMNARRVVSYDDMFYFQRSMAQDLWYAAPRAAIYAFKNFELSDVPAAPGIGPVGNVAVQNKNYRVGLCCALLTDYKIVLNELSFAGFDT